MQADYGELRLVVIESGDDFWRLLDALEDDNSGFLHNKSWIVERYRDGMLYGLCVGETYSMFDRHAMNDPIFLKGSWYMLPCFCTKVKDTRTVDMIWVHSKARRQGLGKALVKLLGIDKAHCPLEEALPFWKACGIPCD
jgi:ribosomal protein S18 acetylase RimI-like enzyme